MQNNKEINDIVNDLLYNINSSLENIKNVEMLVHEHNYLTNLFGLIFSNLAVCKHYLNVASDITNDVKV